MIKKTRTQRTTLLIGAGLILLCLWGLFSFPSLPLAAHHVTEDGYWNATGDLPANMTHHTLQSSYLNPDNDVVGFNVYTPPGYETNSENYPVIYMLHGLSGNERNFFTWYPSFDALYAMTSPFSLIEGTVSPPSGVAIPQAIVVLVNGGAESFYNDFQPDDPYHGPTSPFPIMSDSILINEVIPYVDANFRTIANRSGRAIEGFSMGGRGALKLAFKYPEQFCSVVAFAAAGLDGNPVQQSPYFGPFPPEDQITNIVDAQADAILDAGLAIIMAVGSNDADRGNAELSEQLDSYGISHQYAPSLSGVGHDWRAYYEAAGAQGLDQHGDCFDTTPPPPPTETPTPTATPTATETSTPAPPQNRIYVPIIEARTRPLIFIEHTA